MGIIRRHLWLFPLLLADFSGAFPARAAFAVKGLPKNALVEIEAVAVAAAAKK